ncbi:fimbria/pilus outer membrane usher protein [Zhongshania sp.]|uniref:fimbria/pilus outer membrane usher protein n=1 Tax=Zhongshania sp. TaxID=1971902 RepID=UPI00356613E7
MSRLTLGALLLCCATAHADKLISLTVDGRNLGVVVLVETATGLLIERGDLAAIRDIDSDKLAALPAVAAPACRDCVQLGDIGQVEEDSLRALVSLTLSPGLRRATELFGSGRAREREPLQSGSGFILNYSLLAREDAGTSRQALILEPRLSLGPMGVLDSGWVVDHESGGDTQWRKLDTKLTRYFVDAAMALQLGEVRSLQSYNQAGQSIIGARIARDFSIRPDISTSPVFSFYTDVERPSTVTLFVNGQQRRQQEIQNPGEVRLTDYRPNASGRVAVVVTDITGSEQVMELDLYQDRDLLNPGQVDFSLAAGEFNSERPGLASAPVVDGYFRVGLNHWLALGMAATWTDYQDSGAATLGDDYWLGRLGLTGRLRGLGKFELSYGQHEDSFGSSQSSRLFLSNSFMVPGRLVMSVGGFFFDDDQLRSVTQEDLTHKGYRAFAGLSARQWSATVSGYDIDDIKGIGSTVEYRLGRAQLSASVSASESGAPLYLLRFSYRFGQGLSAGFKSRYQEDNKQFENGAFVRASLWENRLSVTADHAESRSHMDGVGPAPSRSSLRARLEAPVADVSVQYQSLGGEEAVSGLVSGALMVGSALNLQLAPRLSERDGLLTVTSNKPDLPIKVGAEQFTTGADGSAVVAVSSFYKQLVRADANALPLGVYVKNDIQAVAVYPGQGARVHFEVFGLNARIALQGLAAGSPVRIDGETMIYDGRYLQLNDRMPGELRINTELGEFVVEIPAGHYEEDLIQAERVR